MAIAYDHVINDVFVAGTVRFSKNGVDLGHAFDIPAHIRKQAMFASCVLKNAEIAFNFGATNFKYPPEGGYIALCKAPGDSCVNSSITGNAGATVRSCFRGFTLTTCGGGGNDTWRWSN